MENLYDHWTTEKINATDEQILRDISLANVLGCESIYPKVNPFFRNNKRIRAANVPFYPTTDELSHIIRWQDDPRYIVHLTSTVHGSIRNIILRDYQEETLSNYNNHRFNLVVNSRQSGMNVILALQALHYITCSEDKAVAIFCLTKEKSMGLLETIKNIYMQLPYYAQKGVVKWSNKEIRFDNGCRIRCETLNQKNGFAIGYQIHFAIVNDFAYLNSGHNFYQSLYPTLTAVRDSRMTVVSCPNGDNHFKELVEGINIFNKQWIFWDQVPGRDEQWKQDEIKRIGGVEAFAQEYELLFKGSSQWKEYLRENKINSVLDGKNEL